VCACVRVCVCVCVCVCGVPMCSFAPFITPYPWDVNMHASAGMQFPSRPDWLQTVARAVVQTVFQNNITVTRSGPAVCVRACMHVRAHHSCITPIGVHAFLI
jgi:hypothetical protein